MTNRHETRLSFDKVPESYDRSRPEYPGPAFEELLSYLRVRRPVEAPVVLEIGPGTGQATGTLLSRGARVTAVEIGPRLAQFLRRKLASAENLEVLTGAFEGIDLPRAAFDIVFAATSFHWLDQSVRVRKSVELLTPGGVLATLTTIQIQSDVDRGYFERTFPIYQRYRPEEQQGETPTEEEAIPYDYDEFRSSELLEDVVLHRYRWDQTYTTDDYEHLVRSYSSTQIMDSAAREGLLADLRRVIEDEFGGTVVRPLVIGLTLARRR